MSVLTGMGKVNDIFVNHDGVKKPVISGWVNHNGIAVPFYRKGGGAGNYRIRWNVKPYSNQGAASLNLWFMNQANLKKIVIRGTLSSLGGARVSFVTAANSSQSAVHEIGRLTSSGSLEIDYEYEFSQEQKNSNYNAYLYIYSGNYDNVLSSFDIDIFSDSDSIDLKLDGGGSNGSSSVGYSELIFINPEKLGSIQANGRIQIYNGKTTTGTRYCYFRVYAYQTGSTSLTTLRTITATLNLKNSTNSSALINTDINTADWTQYDPDKGLSVQINGSGGSGNNSWSSDITYTISKKTS